MSSSSVPLSTPEGPGSVSGAPNLPAVFTDTFTSRYIDTGELRLHAVSGKVLPSAEHRQRRYRNNRAENSHQAARKRERVMQRLESVAHAQQEWV